MKNITKTGIALLGVVALGAAGSTYAQEDQKISQLDRAELRELRQSGNREAFRERAQELGLKKSARPQLTDEQKAVIEALKESEDHEAIKEQLNEWGIEKRNHSNAKGLRKAGVFDSLTDEQKAEVQELREEGDKEAVQEKLADFGIKLPERPELTDEQKEKIADLKDAGDKEVLKEYFEEIGLKKPRKFMQKRAEVISSLTKDEKEVLQEARDIARAGDKETAREMLQDVFSTENVQEKLSERGVRSFLKRIFRL